MMNSRLVQDPPTDPLLNVDELLSRCLGRLDLVDRVLSKFQQTLREELDELAEAIQSGDAERVSLHAHRMKGNSTTVAAHGLNEYAQRLEQLAMTERFEELDDCFEQLKRECSQLDELITRQREEMG